MANYRVLVSDPISEKGVDALRNAPGISVDVNTGLKPEELIKITTYWKGLMKSGANAMIQAGVISEKEVIGMENDLDQIAKDENAVFFYQFVQAKATL